MSGETDRAAEVLAGAAVSFYDISEVIDRLNEDLRGMNLAVPAGAVIAAREHVITAGDLPYRTVSAQVEQVLITLDEINVNRLAMIDQMVTAASQLVGISTHLAAMAARMRP